MRPNPIHTTGREGNTATEDAQPLFTRGEGDTATDDAQPPHTTGGGKATTI